MNLFLTTQKYDIYSIHSPNAFLISSSVGKVPLLLFNGFPFLNLQVHTATSSSYMLDISNIEFVLHLFFRIEPLAFKGYFQVNP